MGKTEILMWDSNVSGRIVLKIYGERNTGTNYLTELVEKNLDVEVLPGRVDNADLRTRITRRVQRILPMLPSNMHEAARDRFFKMTFQHNLGWKHMNPAVDRIGHEALTSVRFLMLVKNPYAWLLSLFQNPYHVGGRDTQLEAFLARHLPVMELRENIGPDPLPPVEVWNRKMRGYLALKQAATHKAIVHYEDFLVNEQATLHRVAAELGISVRADFEPVAQGVKRAGQGCSHTDYANYYLQELWRKKLNSEAVRQINSQLDVEVVAQMGYQLIDPDEFG